MKLIDKYIQGGWTSKDIRNHPPFKSNCFAEIMADSMEEYEKDELRKKKLSKIMKKYE